uniref:CoA transferase n=1 Tax=unclassified Rhodococcus (in: high G+C Gram-positive bacteria) TaxID=192944 RepID=UPI0020CCF34B|nr:MULTISPECIES: CoA transferase [Rhodococcus]
MHGCAAWPKTHSGGALFRTRVLDLSRVLAGPCTSQMLSDHGADVLEVEGPDLERPRGGPRFNVHGVSALCRELVETETAADFGTYRVQPLGDTNPSHQVLIYRNSLSAMGFSVTDNARMNKSSGID